MRQPTCSQSKLHLQLASAHDFWNFMNLSHNLSCYHLANNLQRTVNQCSWSSSLLLFSSQLHLLSAELHGGTLSSQAVTHRARQQCPPFSTKCQGKAGQGSHSPALSNFPKKYPVPSCCSQPVTLPSFPPIHGPPLLESSSPSEQFWLSLLQASQLFTTKRVP